MTFDTAQRQMMFVQNRLNMSFGEPLNYKASTELISKLPLEVKLARLLKNFTAAYFYCNST